MVIGDENSTFPLDDYKIILQESKFFPISEDLDEIFKELEIFLKKFLHEIKEDQSAND